MKSTLRGRKRAIGKVDKIFKKTYWVCGLYFLIYDLACPWVSVTKLGASRTPEEPQCWGGPWALLGGGALISTPDFSFIQRNSYRSVFHTELNFCLCLKEPRVLPDVEMKREAKDFSDF